MHAHSSISPIKKTTALLSGTATLSGEVNIVQLSLSQFPGAFHISNIRAKK